MSDRVYEVVKSRDGKNIIRITEKDRSIHIGSKYNTNRDVENFLYSLGSIGSEDKIIVFGLACGEHLYELKEKLGENSKIIVFEPDENIVNIFSNLESAKTILSDNRFKIFYFDQEDGIENAMGSSILDYEISSITFSYYANYDHVYREKFQCFINQLKDYLKKVHVNRNTNIAFSKIWFDAFLRNIKVMSKGTSLDELKDKYPNKPAIIVSAGPSLKKNIHLLKKAQEKFIIITGGRTLKALIDTGVTPHFVCVIDPVEKTYKLLEECLDCNAPLVFYEGTNPDVVEKYKGQKIYFNTNYFAGDFIQKTEIKLNYGGSVAHTCFGLAMHLGCDKIIFVGQDFAYTDDKIHAENAIVKEEENDFTIDSGYIYVDDIYGNKVKTDEIFDLFRKTMENLIKFFPGRTYINSTEGGANIRGAMVIPLEEALVKYSINETFKIIYELNINDNYDEVIAKEKHVLEKLVKIKSSCEEGVKLSNELIAVVNNGAKKKLKNINRKLDHIDNKIKAVFDEAAFVNYILYPVTQMILGSSEFRINTKDSDTVMGKKITSKAKKLYEEMNKVLCEAIAIIEKNLS